MTDISALHELLEPHGLILGGVLNEPGFGELPAGDNEINARQLILVANAGSAIWRPFVDSPEYGDPMVDPMDRWSRRIGEDIARKLGGRAIFPFEGPPYPPFLNWAGQAGQAFPSPLSLFVHREYGLWQAWRFALAMPRPLSGTVPASKELSPCVNCPQPCLDACPVDAFSSQDYRVNQCVDYLRSDEKSACREQGCAARRACPIGTTFKYEADHAQFHMAAFLNSRPLKG